MGCALKIFQRPAEQKQGLEKRFLILGLDNAGKTSILQRLTKKEATVTAPTVGLNVEEIEYRGTKIVVWDVGGAATLLWKHYYQDTDAIIFVIDSADMERIPEVKEELNKVIEEQTIVEVPLLIYGNKQDMEKSMKDNALSAAIEFEAIKKKHKLVYLCSAKEDKGIWEGFEKLLEIVLHNTLKA